MFLPAKSSIVSTVFLFTLVINTVPAVPSLKDSTEHTRLKKRSYYPWAVSGNTVPLYNAANVYKPSRYTISRPYYAPVYGLSGGNLLYYPSQPLYSNVEAPQKGHPRSPALIKPSFQAQNQQGGNINNRFGDDDDDDRPMWGGGAMNSIPLSGDKPREYTVTPTRPPGASLRPAPPVIRDPKSPLPASSLLKPDPPASNAISTVGPSNCVWAIISCCSTTNPGALPINCFEARGCPGPFWGGSPCMGEYAKAAIDSAMKYFGEG